MYILMFIIFSVIGLGVSKIELEVKDLNILYNGKMQKLNYEIIVRIKIFREITIFKVRLKKDKIDQILKRKKKKIQQRIKNKKLNKKKLIGIEILQQILEYKKIEIMYKDVKIFAKIGVEDMLLTAYLTAFLSTVISIFYELKVEDKKEFKIEPIFKEENNIEIIVNGKAGIYIRSIIYSMIQNFKKIRYLRKVYE